MGQLDGSFIIAREKLKNKIVNSEILTDVMGSDHAPVAIEIND